jgi:protein arginine kinase
LSVVKNDGAWYFSNGSDSDVILSSRVRLARNLANFPFRGRMRGDDRERVKAILFDAFSHFQDAELYHALGVKDMDLLGIRIMEERGILSDNRTNGEGLVVRADGKAACVVNCEDHARISAFSSGLDFGSCERLCEEIDGRLQDVVQFAASYDFGYLTSSIFDSGSGMKTSARIHIPSLEFLKEDNSVFELASKSGYKILPCYDIGYKMTIGSYYQVSGITGAEGNQIDQLASISALCHRICALERKARETVKEKYPTILRNVIYKAFALSRYSSVLSLREAIETISGVKWGVDTGIVSGISEAELFALLYKIQPAHLEFVLKNSRLSFENDIESDIKYKIGRLRSLMLQEAFVKLEIKE